VSLSEKVFKLIIMCVFALLNYLPDLKYVFKATPLAMGALVVSSLILIISIAFNTDNITMDFLKIKPLSAADVLAVASINGFAFICHPSVSPMIKENSDQTQNDKAVYSGYAVTTVLYLIVGVLGALSIYGRVPTMDKASYNIIDYFSGQFQAPIIGFLTFLYLFMISPIFPYVSKNQAIELIPKEKREKIPRLWLKVTVIFSILWFICNILFILLDTAPTVVIGFISTVLSYYVTYFLPIFMCFKVGDYVAKGVPQNLEESLIVHEKEGDIETAESNTLMAAKPPLQNESIITEYNQTVVEEGPPKQKWLKIFYFSVLGYGTVMLIFELISFFT
jgi:amino acid permease